MGRRPHRHAIPPTLVIIKQIDIRDIPLFKANFQKKHIDNCQLSTILMQHRLRTGRSLELDDTVASLRVARARVSPLDAPAFSGPATMASNMPSPHPLAPLLAPGSVAI